MTWNGIFENIISNVAFIMIVFLVGLVFPFISKRYFLYRFFGVSNIRVLNIYLSNIRVNNPFQSIGTDGRKYSYTGEAITYKEMQVGLKIEKLFRLTLPDLGDVNKFIGKILLSDIKIIINASPTVVDKIDKESSIISIGTPAYNRVSEFIENQLNSIVTFKLGRATLEGLLPHVGGSPIVLSDSDNNIYDISAGLNINGNFENYSGTANALDSYQKSPIVSSRESAETKSKYEPSEILIKDTEPITDTTKAIIERLVDNKNHKAYFLIAGLSELASVAAASHLVANWFGFYKKFKSDQSFLIVLKVDDNDPNVCKELYSKNID